MQDELETKGFKNLIVWTRGTDHELFSPLKRGNLGFEAPISLYVGRVSVEKNLKVFLDADLPGTKVIVGDGPSKKEYEKKYPDVKFVGYKHGEELAKYYASSDVFVFPSASDTFGVVIIEAMSCGTPTAAYDTTGPRDIIKNGVDGYLGEDLKDSILKCVKLNREKVHEALLKWTWDKGADIFLETLHLISDVGRE